MHISILESRIQDLDKVASECLAQYHQVLGRLQECRYILQQLEIQDLVDDGEKVE